jgi:hypothetical protein
MPNDLKPQTPNTNHYPKPQPQKWQILSSYCNELSRILQRRLPTISESLNPKLHNPNPILSSFCNELSRISTAALPRFGVSSF